MLRGTLRAAQVDGTPERCGVAFADGSVITGLNVNHAAVGAEVVAGIRPERIVVHAHDAPQPHNAVRASVRNVIYFGDHLRLLCSVGSGGDIASQDDATVKLPLAASSIPQPGDALWLQFPPELTRIYS